MMQVLPHDEAKKDDDFWSPRGPVGPPATAFVPPGLPCGQLSHMQGGPGLSPVAFGASSCFTWRLETRRGHHHAPLGLPAGALGPASWGIVACLLVLVDVLYVAERPACRCVGACLICIMACLLVLVDLLHVALGPACRYGIKKACRVADYDAPKSNPGSAARDVKRERGSCW